MNFNFDKLFDNKNFLDEQINIDLNYQNNNLIDPYQKSTDKFEINEIFNKSKNRKTNKSSNFIREDYFSSQVEDGNKFEINLQFEDKIKKTIPKKTTYNEFWDFIKLNVKIGIYKNGILFYNNLGVFSLFMTNNFDFILVNVVSHHKIKDEIFINYSDQDFLISETSNGKIKGDYILFKNNKFFKTNNKNKKLSKYCLLDSKKKNCIRIKSKLKTKYQIIDYKVIKDLNINKIDSYSDILDFLIFRRVIFNNEIFTNDYFIEDHKKFKNKFNIKYLDYMKNIYKKNWEEICLKKLSKKNDFIKNNFGIKFENNGNILIGIFFNNLLQIFSSKIDTIGNKYVGEFVDGKLNGFGIINYIYNNSKIIGYFKNSKIEDFLVWEDKSKNKFYFLQKSENIDELKIIKEFDGLFNVKILFDLIKGLIIKKYYLELFCLSDIPFINNIIYNKHKDIKEDKNDIDINMIKKIKEKLKINKFIFPSVLELEDIYEIFVRKFKNENIVNINKNYMEIPNNIIHRKHTIKPVFENLDSYTSDLLFN